MHMHSSSTKGKGSAMPDKPMLSPDAFSKNPDGSWSSTQNTDIKSPVGIIRLSAGMQFKKGQTYWGINVVELLEAGGSA